MTLNRGRWQLMVCTSIVMVCAFDAQGQTVINSLNQPAQTPADGESLTVTGTGSVVTAGSRAVLGAGNNAIIVNTPTVAGGGTIQGLARGVDINNAPGTVDNSGTITGTSSTSIGIDLGAGGSVTNQSGGTISGGLTAVLGGSTSTAVDVVNDGLINGGTSDGVSLQGGGTVNNTNSITGTKSAIRIQNGAAASNEVINSGTLQSAITGFDSAVQFNSTGGSVNNQAGGVISGAGGVNFGGVGDVINAGEISATNSNAIRISGGGMVTNSATGTVNGSIAINGAAGTVDNSGAITGGVAMSAGGTVTNGKTVNGGVAVSGGSAATNEISNMTGATISGGFLTGASLSAGGDITNHGSVSGGSGVNIGGSGGTLTNTGMVNATGAFGTAVQVANGSIVDNSGSIVSENAQAVSMGGGLAQTTLTNRTGGQIIGGPSSFLDAVSVGSDFMIDNDGLIRGQGRNDFFDLTAIFGFGVTGTLTNRENGTIENLVSGVAIEFAGSSVQTIENAGIINGNVKLDGGADIVMLKPGSVINGALDAGSGLDSLEFNAPTGTSGALDFDTTTVAGFDGETGKKTGAGIWTLTGTNATFSPVFTAEAGTLIVNSTTPGLAPTVAVGATIGGTGTIGGITNSGTVAPGNSIGTLNVAGNAAFDAGSIIEVEVASDGTSDLIDATGSTAINGGTVNVLPVSSEDSYADGQRFTILRSSGGIAGRFNGVTDLSAFLDFALSYDPNTVYLTLTKVADFASVAQTFNQFQVAGALQTLDISTGSDGNSVAAALLGLDASAARAAYDSIQGEVHADSQLIGADIAGLFNSLLLSQAKSPAGAAGATGITRSAYAADRVRRSFENQAATFDLLNPRGTAPALPDPSIVAWGGGFGSSIDVDGDGNAAEWTSQLAGFATGLEFDLGHKMSAGTVAGIAAGYSHTTGHVNARRQAIDIEAYHVGVYGRTGANHNQVGFAAQAAASYAFQQFETHRNIVFAGVNRTAMALYNGHAFSVAAEARYGFGLPDNLFGMRGSAIIAPLARLDGRFLRHDGFTESGASSLNLSSDGESFSQGSLVVGLVVEGDYLVGGVSLRPSYSIAYERVIGEAMPSANLTLAASPTVFAVRGPNESRDRLRLDAALSADLSKRATFNVSVGSVMSADRANISGNTALKIRF